MCEWLIEWISGESEGAVSPQVHEPARDEWPRAVWPHHHHERRHPGLLPERGLVQTGLLPPQLFLLSVRDDLCAGQLLNTQGRKKRRAERMTHAQIFFTKNVWSWNLDVYTHPFLQRRVVQLQKSWQTYNQSPSPIPPPNQLTRTGHHSPFKIKSCRKGTKITQKPSIFSFFLLFCVVNLFIIKLKK